MNVSVSRTVGEGFEVDFVYPKIMKIMFLRIEHIDPESIQEHFRGSSWSIALRVRSKKVFRTDESSKNIQNCSGVLYVRSIRNEAAREFISVSTNGKLHESSHRRQD